MNAAQITKLLSGYDKGVRDAFRCVCPMDEFLETAIDTIDWSSENIFVVNNQGSREKGEHWVLIKIYPHAIEKNVMNIVFFDSFAFDVSYYSLKLPELLQIISDGMIQSVPYKIQDVNSKLCGLYCVFIAYRLSAYDNDLLMLIKNDFSEINLHENDLKLIRWARRQPFHTYLHENCVQNECMSFSDLL